MQKKWWKQRIRVRQTPYLVTVTEKNHQWIIKLVGKKYYEKHGFSIVSKYLPTRYLRITKEETATWQRRDLASDQIRSVAQSCPILCDPMNRSTPGLPVHHQLPEFTQTHVHRASEAIQPSHPLSSPSPPAPNPSQHQSLFQWVNSSHEVAKVLEFQL